MLTVVATIILLPMAGGSVWLCFRELRRPEDSLVSPAQATMRIVCALLLFALILRILGGLFYMDARVWPARECLYFWVHSVGIALVAATIAIFDMLLIAVSRRRVQRRMKS